MSTLYKFCFLILLLFLHACSASKKSAPAYQSEKIISTIKLKIKVPPVKIDSKGTEPEAFVDFAETLIGIPYKYGGTKKETGFDCSGFVGYVFQHFNIMVPRTSIEFTNAGTAVDADQAKRGDLILFTGFDPKSGKVGHMGIITSVKKNDIRFIHAASGNNKGVMVSGMSPYFRERYVKINRIF